MAEKHNVFFVNVLDFSAPLSNVDCGLITDTGILYCLTCNILRTMGFQSSLDILKSQPLLK